MSPKFAKMFTRVMAIFLAFLMLGGVVLAAFQSFALEPQSYLLNIANTGDTYMKYGVIIVAVVAVIVLVCALVLPKILKKK